MERNIKYEEVGWVEFDDGSIDKTLADLNKFVETAKTNGYFDIEFIGGCMQVYGYRHETDAEFEIRQKSNARREKAIEKQQRREYERLKQLFEPNT